jgi:diguanylate cyclase
MPDPPAKVLATPNPTPVRSRALQSLPQRTYWFRVLGMGLASLPVAAVMAEIHAGWLSWAWMIFSCLLWPHLAYAWARRSEDPFRSELRNFVIDSAIAGSWVPLMHFNLLPSIVLITVVIADKVNSGVRNLWLYALPGTAIALLVGAAATGFAYQPASSMTVVLASLPILVIHTLAVSFSSYKLVRRVQRQNLQLEQLSRIDGLTGLPNRRHWQSLAETLLADHLARGQVATLMLLDVDRFKEINDRFGHAVGDDVLCGIAGVVTETTQSIGVPGRLGGDEFVIVLPVGMDAASAVAERVRAAVEAMEFPKVPGLACSVSIGLAEPPDADLGLREWIEAADRALYRAKRAGRNTTAGREASPASGH